MVCLIHLCKYRQDDKPQLHVHDFGHGRATIHLDLSSPDALAWVVAVP